VSILEAGKARLPRNNWKLEVGVIFCIYMKNILGKDSNIISLWCIEGHYA